MSIANILVLSCLFVTSRPNLSTTQASTGIPIDSATTPPFDFEYSITYFLRTTGGLLTYGRVFFSLAERPMSSRGCRGAILSLIIRVPLHRDRAPLHFCVIFKEKPGPSMRLQPPASPKGIDPP